MNARLPIPSATASRASVFNGARRGVVAKIIRPGRLLHTFRVLSHFHNLDPFAVTCICQIRERGSLLVRLPGLVKAYEALDGRDHATIQNIARTIREAGFIPTTKRGSGASVMSERDVVNLILGANGSETAAGAPKAVERLRELRRVRTEVPSSAIDWRRGDLNWAMIDEHVHRHFHGSIWEPILAFERFGEALEWLTRNAASIDAKMTELSLRLVSGEAPIQTAAAPAWDAGAFKLTIARDEASFEAAAPAIKGFADIRVRYALGEGKCGRPTSELPRRAFVEIDFRMIRELALLVSPKLRPDAASSGPRLAAPNRARG